MTRLLIEPYDTRHADQVAELLIHRRHERRKHCPLLPPGLDDPSTAALILKDLGAGSVAVTGEGRVAGFLFAEREDDPTWGPGVVVAVDHWALAAEAGIGVLTRLYAREFEAKAAGVGEHYVYCPAFDKAALEAWFQLGFGMEQAYGAARLSEMTAPYSGSDLEIRKAGPGDEDTLGELSPLIASMQSRAPVWAGAPPKYLADIHEGYRGLATDPEAIAVFLAFRNGRAVGHQSWFPFPAHPVDGATEGAAELGVAATRPEERGTGVGLALTARGITEARKAGYAVCFTDWRTTNPLSSAFWTARGLQPFLYRLARRISPLSLQTIL